MKWQIKVEVKNGRWVNMGEFPTREQARLVKNLISVRYNNVVVSKVTPKLSFWQRIWEAVAG